MSQRLTSITRQIPTMRMNSDSEGSIYADLVSVELGQMFRKEYWSRLSIIQELVVSPIISTVYWGESVFQLSRLWKEQKPGLGLLALITQWWALKINPGDMERSLTDTFIQEL